MNKGFFLLHRALWDKQWFAEDMDFEQQMIVINIVRLANWEPNKLRTGLVLQPGQLAISERKFADKIKTTRQRLRTVLTICSNVEFATHKITHGFTVITIVNWDTYQGYNKAINPDTKPTPTQSQPTANPDLTIKQVTTNNKDPLVQANARTKRPFSADDRKAAEYILGRVRALKPDFKEPNLDQWANDVRLMREIDGRTPKEICELMRWANADPFWRTNILSPATLRKQWDKLAIKRANPETKPGQATPAPFKPFDLKSIYE